MLEKIKDVLLRDEEERPPQRIAKIKFHSDLKLDNPLAKEIRLYESERLIDTSDYSDVMLEELSQMGFQISDETGMEDVPVFSHWEGGRVLLEDIER